jgi:hypothetical protein
MLYTVSEEEQLASDIRDDMAADLGFYPEERLRPEDAVAIPGWEPPAREVPDPRHVKTGGGCDPDKPPAPAVPVKPKVVSPEQRSHGSEASELLRDVMSPALRDITLNLPETEKAARAMFYGGLLAMADTQLPLRDGDFPQTRLMKYIQSPLCVTEELRILVTQHLQLVLRHGWRAYRKKSIAEQYWVARDKRRVECERIQTEYDEAYGPGR